MALIPGADYLYFGDTARLPYGSKSVETVARYAVEATHFLERPGREPARHRLQHRNRAGSRSDHPAPPTYLSSAWLSLAQSRPPPPARTRRVVVIGTEATVSSHAYLKALERRGDRSP